MEVEISETIDYDGETYTVTAIGVNAFRDKGLTSIDIPNSVTSIGTGAFNTNQLTSIEIPENVTTIGGDAFADNELKSVTIPGSVTSIGAGAFQSNGLEEVSSSTPSQLTSIGKSAFADNELTQVTIPERVTSIDSLAFAGNSINNVFVKAIDPPSLPQGAFKDRTQIDLVVPREGVYNEPTEGWTGFKSVSSSIEQRFTVGGIEYEITAPTQVEIVGYNTSFGTEVDIPPTAMDNSSNITYTVTAIGDSAFLNKQLTKVTFSGQSNVTRIGEDAFWGGNTSVNVGNTLANQ